MNIRPVTEWTFYKWRFVIAYLATGLLLGGLLLVYANSVPPGLSAGEQQSVITAASIKFTELPQQIVDLPYYLSQKISVEFLGITPFGVRLPSLIFAALTALCLILILRRWFQTNVAIVAGIIIITSTWFLTMGRLGTPIIMIPFWTSALILAATHISQQSKSLHLWKPFFGFVAALSLYTPYMAYLFIAALLAAIAQPHLRFLIRQSSKIGLSIGLFFFVLVLAPLGWGIYSNLGIISQLLAIPASLPEPLTFLQNLIQTVSNLLNPFNNSLGETVTPALSIVSVILVILGGLRLLSDFHSVRAYLLLIWAAILIPIAAFNPDNLAVLFVPCALIMTIGLTLIIKYWYKLFPRNPYARIFGLLPLAILVFSIVQFNYQRYFYNMNYAVEAGQVFKPDAFMAQAEISKTTDNSNLRVVVPKADKKLYQIMAQKRPNTTVLTALEAKPRQGKWIVAESEVSKVQSVLAKPPQKLLVSDRKEDALRFRVY